MMANARRYSAAADELWRRLRLGLAGDSASAKDSGGLVSIGVGVATGATSVVFLPVAFTPLGRNFPFAYLGEATNGGLGSINGSRMRRSSGRARKISDTSFTAAGSSPRMHA